MRYLLDTHTFIWINDNPKQISKSVTAIIQSSQNSFLLSFVSIWEMQIKANLGKLTFKQSLTLIVRDNEQRNNLALLPIDLSHIYALEQLPHHHRDPFDRLIIAQAMIEGLPILSNDPLFSQYPVRVVW